MLVGHLSVAFRKFHCNTLLFLHHTLRGGCHVLACKDGTVLAEKRVSLEES